MFKRLFTTVLVAVMVVTAVPSAMAAKKTNNFSKQSRNIYYLWGDFETAEQIQHLTTSREANSARESYKTTELSLVSGGAESSKNALQVKMDSADSDDYINFHFPGISYEKYKISFWLKTDAPGAKDISMMIEYFKFDKSETITIPLVASDGEWHKYEYTWTCGDSDTNYRLGDGGSQNLRFALTGCTGAYTFCLDRLSVEPYGFVDWDYSSVNVHYNYAMGIVPEEPVYGNTDTNPFSDISSHWGREVIRSLAGTGMINGMGDGTFAPDKNVTRAEFIKMIVGALADRDVKYDGRYTDVAQSSWYAPYIALADSYVILANEMKEGSKILPEKPITREEAATIIAKVAKYKGAKADKTTIFSDEAQISGWARDEVKASAAYGIINGYEDGTFRPANNITRAEAAKMLSKVVEITDRLAIYVDAEAGNDKNDGTSDLPLKTVVAARDMAKKYSDDMQNDIFIFIRGEHYFDETFVLNEKDSGKNGYDVVYTSWGEEKPIFTMAKKYTGFEIHDADKNIWKTFVGKGVHSRQAYFNEVKGIRSRTIGYLENCELVNDTYYLCDNMELLDLQYPAEVDTVHHVYWTNNRYMIKSITEENGRVRIDFGDYFHENKYRVVEKNSHSSLIRTPSYLENAYEFLDQQGEWYLNKHDGYMYYIPRSGEEMSTMELKLPLGEDLIDGIGSSYNHLLTNITFDNIQFEGTTWFRIDELGGFAPLQNNLLTGTRENGHDGKTGQSVGAAMNFSKCENITFTNNFFRHMGMTCLEFIEGAKYITIEGNEFGDISSHALLVDDVSLSGWFATKPMEQWCEYYEINNNYIHHVATDYNGSAAVGLGFIRHTDFEHNQISHSPYSGLHIGWGWPQYIDSGNINYDIDINYNHITDVMFGRVNDGAAIYNLGGASRENDSFPDAPNQGINKLRMMGNYLVNTWNSEGIYPDQGSSNWYIANNVTDVGKYLKYKPWNFEKGGVSYPHEFYWSHMHSANISYLTFENNYSTHDFAYVSGYMNQLESSIEPVNICPDRNWPAEAQEIIAEAGIEEKYRDNFDLDTPDVFMGNNKWMKVEVNLPTDPGLFVWNSDIETTSLDDYDIRWWFSDPEALRYEDGKIIATKEGHYEAEVWAVVDGVDMNHHYMIEVHRPIEKVAFNPDKVNLMAGVEIPLNISAIAGDYEKNITYSDDVEVEIHLEDPTVATIEYDEVYRYYTVKGLSKGKTEATGTITYLGVPYPFSMDISVIVYDSDEAEKLPYREVAYHQNWSTGAIPVSGGGIKVGASPAYWLGEKIENELIAFDMEIDPGHRWPAIVFCNSQTSGDYNTVDNYMIGFKENFIEVQRWNNGVRTYIFGESNLNPIAGPGVPNTGDDKFYEYNKRYSVIVGALDTPEGTRIILTINGDNIIDYTDNTEKRLPASGYFASYNPAPGGTTYYPYSGITNE